MPLLTDPEEKAWAKINEAYGPGATYELDGKVIACAGIRTYGLGEIWGVFSDKAKDIKFTLGKESKRQLHAMMEQEDLDQVIATVDSRCTKTQRDFLEFLGFQKVECFVIRREE